MVSVYRDENLKQLIRKRTIWFLVYTAAALAVLAFCTAMCVLLRNTRKTYYIWIGAAVFCLGGWAVILDYFRRVHPLTVKIRHLTGLSSGVRKSFDGSIAEIDGPVTREKAVRAYRIKLLCGGSERYVYWNEVCGPVPFSVGDAVSVNTSERYVVAYEVKRDGLR